MCADISGCEVFRPPFTCFFTDMPLTSNFLSRSALNLPSPTHTGRPRRPESPVCLNPDERLVVLKATRARTAAHCQQSSDAWSQLNVTSPVALQVTSPTPKHLTGDQIEPETVGNEDRIHPPPGIIHQDDNLEDDHLEDDLEDDLKVHHSSGSINWIRRIQLQHPTRRSRLICAFKCREWHLQCDMSRIALCTSKRHAAEFGHITY